MTADQILALVLFLPAVARATKLVNDDLITDPIRAAVMTRWGAQSTPAYFLQCPWCVSIWIGFPAAWAVLAFADLSLWLIPLLGFTASYATGLAAQLLPSDDAEIETVK